MFSDFYGNDDIQNTLQQMLRRDRAAHVFSFMATAVWAKRPLPHMLPRRCSVLVMKNPVACANPAACLKNIPILMQFLPNTAANAADFRSKLCAKFCTDLATPPNEGDAKCYFFFDCDNMDARTQNLLLKAIEEPPSYAYSSLTAQAQTALLPTIRSRIIAMALMPVSESDLPSGIDAAWLCGGRL